MNKSEWLASRCPNETQTAPTPLGRSVARLTHCATNDAAHFGGPHGMFVDVPVRDLSAALARLEKLEAAMVAMRPHTSEVGQLRFMIDAAMGDA